MTDDVASTHHTPAHALERLIFFSDAVFAISITLLVIELHAPHIPWGSPDVAYLRALADLAPNFLAFVISFFVIGAFWAGHHRAFDCARHWHPKLMMPNLCMLFAVAAMPFFTAFLSQGFGRRVPTIAYCGWLLVLSLLNIWVQRLAVSPPVADEHLDPARVVLIKRRGVAVAAGATTALIFAILVPVLAQLMLMTMPLYRWLLGRWAARARPVPAPAST